MKVIQVRDLLHWRFFQIKIEDKADLQLHQKILLQNDKNQIVGEVLSTPRDIPSAKIEENHKFIKPLSESEIKTYEKLNEDNFDRVLFARELAEKEKIKMHFFASRTSLDEKIFSFFFTSEGNVDFREIVKELASKYRKRINLQRVNMVERSRVIGACYDFSGRDNADDFDRFFNEKPNMNAVRDQGIMIKNNARIFEHSGKLKGSLVYEVENYRYNRKFLPHLQQTVKVNNRIGKVKNLDILNKKVRVIFDDGIYDNFHISEISYDGKISEPEQKPLETAPTPDMYEEGI